MIDEGLRLGDCTDPASGLASMATDSIDHVICDPPYSRTIYFRVRNPDDKRIGAGLRAMKAGEIGYVDDLCAPVAREIARVCKRWALVFSDVEFCHRWKEELESNGMRYMRTGIWVKPDAMPQMTGDRPAVGFEPLTICHAAGKSRWNGGGRNGVWICGIERTDRPDHPCPKPLSLMEALIRDFTDPGDLIVDPFAGSGTTGVAAIRLGRRFIGWERDQRYFEIAMKRLAATREQLALFA